MNVKKTLSLSLLLMIFLYSDYLIAGALYGSTNGNQYLRITPLMETVDPSLKNSDGTLKDLPQGKLEDSTVEKLKKTKAKYEKCSYHFNNKDELVPFDCIPIYGTPANCYLPVGDTFGPTMWNETAANIVDNTVGVVAYSSETFAYFLIGGEIYYGAKFLEFAAMNMYKIIAGEILAGIAVIEISSAGTEAIKTISRIFTSESMKKQKVHVITGDASMDAGYKKAKTFNYGVLSGLEFGVLDENKIMTLSEVEMNIGEAIKGELSSKSVTCEYHYESNMQHSEPSTTPIVVPTPGSFFDPSPEYDYKNLNVK